MPDSKGYDNCLRDTASTRLCGTLTADPKGVDGAGFRPGQGLYTP